MVDMEALVVDLLVMEVIANLIRDPCVRLLLISLGLPLLKGLQLRQALPPQGLLAPMELQRVKP